MKFAEKFKTHISCSKTFLNHDAYEIMWKNTVDVGRPQLAIRRMRFACWITKATQYVILIAFPL